MARKVFLETPVSEQEIRDLHLDDMVFLTGRIFVFQYPWHFTRTIEMLGRNEKLPMDLNGSMIYHCPAGYRKVGNDFELKFVGSTTSSKLNAYTPDFMKLTGIRGVIGKGGMDTETLKAMKELGACYFAVVGGCSAIYTEGVVNIVQEYWNQPSWADNVLELDIKNFGPLLVAMDAKGNSIYEKAKQDAQKALPLIYKTLGV